MESQDIEVMGADASHEVYVETILDTIREAAKVRGTGIAEVPGARVGETYQTGFFPVGPLALAVGENLFVDERCRRYEDEHRIGVRSRNVQRVDR